ncbi:hypothetical protein R5W24_004806 [Gemmata sp. JC717]|uniref:Uncharacterized protein n=1 Tax=Gemmata algarum TaxID=2975278 RepID=A0ABU5F5Q5_9BACT|nr:hypothetical protein [Gemmata algarum]MDY3555661.1 hypothetical protein [Gemmata algarum]MDY3562900.1 hypothetical protein [Gemmata algarum]
MTFGMVVRLPVNGAFGTDEDFDLRTRLEHDLDAALLAGAAGECGRGATDAGFINIALESITTPDTALIVVKDVLARHGLLPRVTIVLESPDEDDPDDTLRRVLWPLQPSPADAA